MLERVLEPEVMESTAEAEAYDAMDHREVNAAMVDDLLAAGLQRGDVLDLGTGTAQIPIELCGRNEEVRVMAVDLAASMLELARINIDMAGMLDRIQLEQVDAKGLDFADDMFDCVMSNSIVHHIPQPAGVLAEAVRVTASGGLLFVRDLARPESDAAVTHLVETYAAGQSDHARQLFDDSFRAALTVEEMQVLVAPLGAPGESVTMTSDRHWTWVWRKPAS